MPVDTLKTAKKAIGAKQAAKAVEKAGKPGIRGSGRRSEGNGSDSRLCGRRGVAVETVPSMDELGKACGIEVGAAAVALLKG